MDPSQWPGSHSKIHTDAEHQSNPSVFLPHGTLLYRAPQALTEMQESGQVLEGYLRLKQEQNQTKLYTILLSPQAIYTLSIQYIVVVIIEYYTLLPLTDEAMTFHLTCP